MGQIALIEITAKFVAGNKKVFLQGSTLVCLSYRSQLTNIIYWIPVLDFTEKIEHNPNKIKIIK
jgi:hypothetical protein